MRIKNKTNTLAYTLLIIFLGFNLFLNIRFITTYAFREDYIRRMDFVFYYLGTNLITDGMSKKLYDVNFYRNTNEYDIYDYYRDKTEVERDKPLANFRALPITALMYLPFSGFYITTSFYLYMVFNALLLTTVAFLLARKKTYAKGILIFLVVFSYKPTAYVLTLGQYSSAILLVITLVYLALKKGNYLLSGFLSLFTLLKTHFVLLVPYFFLKATDKPKFIKGSMLSVLVILVISLFLVPIETLLNYPNFLKLTENPEFLSPPQLQISIQAVMASLVNKSPLSKEILILSGLTYLFSLLVTKIRDLEISISLATILGTLLTVHLFGQDLIVMILPITLLFLKGYEICSQEKRAGGLLMLASLLVYSVAIIHETPAFVVVAISFLSVLITLYVYTKYKEVFSQFYSKP